jgi:2-polyprenyl-3-methyl-5-hydroxy-6-metoxy-1,4-benzoquinol methylase
MKCIICGSGTDRFYNDLFDDRYGAPGFFSINRCRNCGIGRTEPLLKKEEIGKFYKKFYPLSFVKPEQVKDMARILPKFTAWLNGVDNTSHWHVKPKTDVLDIGSGSGVSLLEIEKMGAKAYGVEPDPNAQKIAKKLNLDVFKGFISDNPFPNHKFDFVTCSQVIEHEPDPLHFLNSVKKKLKKGGRVILSFPNFDSLYRIIFGRKWINWHIPYHLNFFTKKSFILLAEKSGLKVTRMETRTPNLWSVIQIRTFFESIKMGQKSSVWNRSPVVGKTNGKSDILARLIGGLLQLMTIPITLVNRIVDFLGMGDSFLVFLENEK